MSKVISLDDKLKLSAEQRAALERKRKILAVRKIFQCTHCASKCERCGAGVGPEHKRSDGSARIPYNFCDSCAEEYIEYINRLQGRGNKKTTGTTIPGTRSGRLGSNIRVPLINTCSQKNSASCWTN
jgi:hypothetical protein